MDEATEQPNVPAELEVVPDTVPRADFIEAVKSRQRVKAKLREAEERATAAEAAAMQSDADRRAWENLHKDTFRKETGIEPAEDFGEFMAQHKAHHEATVAELEAQIVRLDAIEANRQIAATWQPGMMAKEAPTAAALHELAAIVVDRVKLDGTHDSERQLMALQLEDLIN